MKEKDKIIIKLLNILSEMYEYLKETEEEEELYNEAALSIVTIDKYYESLERWIMEYVKVKK